MEMSASSATGSAGTQIYGTGSGSIDSGTQKKILDLRTSEQELLNIIDKVVGDNNLTPLQQQQFQYLLTKRSERTSLLTNLIRTLAESLREILRNFRI